MLTKDEIISYLKANKDFLTQHFHLKKIGLFGSFARNEQKNDSDIDIIIELEDNTPMIYELKTELSSLIRKKFNREVDIAREKYLKKFIKEEIKKEVFYV